MSLNQHLEGRVFISHASSDLGVANLVAARLNGEGIGTALDHDMLRLGQSFVQFMETALSEARYCLLLWSHAAAQRPWVTAEWHAALVRSVLEEFAFLVTARLEDIEVPRLLAPRVWIDLFPSLEPGIEKLLLLLSEDNSARQVTAKPAAPAAFVFPGGGNATVYVTSSLFDVTLPVRTDLDAPMGVLLKTLVETLQLPSYQPLDPNGRIVVRVTYSLVYGQQTLNRIDSLSKAGVGHAAILTLESRFEFVSATEPADGSPGLSTFREFRTSERAAIPETSAVLAPLLRDADRLMRSAVRHAGLYRQR
jgi:hypothetical protein